MGRAQARRGSQEAARGDWLPPLIASCPWPLANDFAAVNGLRNARSSHAARATLRGLPASCAECGLR